MFEKLDFTAFHSCDHVERDQFCRRLVLGLAEQGFVRLVNHGIPRSAIDGAFETSQHFFTMPHEQKMKSPHPPTANPHRGFTPAGVENVSAVSSYGRAAKSLALPLLKDMKESYDIGSEKDELYGNIWPPGGVCDDFQPVFVDFFNACYEAELLLLQAISTGLGLPSQALSQMHTAQHNELRLTHYPEVERSSFSHSTRIAAHTDFGSITLLFQDDVGGLQVEYPADSGNFVDIDSGGRYECIINAGDCLEKWTGLRSARHRVHLPDSSDQTARDASADIIYERFSIAYFAKPDRTAALRPLPASHEDATTTYMTAGEFQLMRINGTY